MSSPPVVSCPVIKAGLSSHLTTLTSRWMAMRTRVLDGLQPVKAVRDAYQALAQGDPTDCFGRADRAVADAEAWLMGGDTHVLGTPGAGGVVAAIAREIGEIDCDGPVAESDMHTKNAMTALTILGWWLDARDQELGTLEAHWRQIADGCPVPPPQPANPDEAPPFDDPEGP